MNIREAYDIDNRPIFVGDQVVCVVDYLKSRRVVSDIIKDDLVVLAANPSKDPDANIVCKSGKVKLLYIDKHTEE
jgi:hypothetical protein